MRSAKVKYDLLISSINMQSVSLDNLCFFVILFMHLIPIWSYTYFPSQDGPVHLYTATILRSLISDSDGIYHDYFIINYNTLSNWVFSLIMSGMMSFVSPLTAEKIILSVYIFVLPISVRYAIGSINSESKFVSLLIFPFLYNYNFHKGFYSFILSTPGYFFIIGFWIKHKYGFKIKHVIMLSLLILTTYLFHIVSFIMSALSITIISSIDILKKITTTEMSLPDTANLLKKEALNLITPLCPSLICVLLFFSTNGTDMQYNTPIIERMINFVSIDVLFSFSKYEILFSCFLFFLFFTISFFIIEDKHRNKSYYISDIFFILAVVLSIVYLFSPDIASGGSYIASRVLLYPFFCMIIWIGAQFHSRPLRKYIAFSSISVSLIMLLIHMVSYSTLNKDLGGYLRVADHVKPNTTILPISFLHKDPNTRIGTFLHATSYITAEKRTVNLLNYQASTDYFPIMYNQEMDPYRHISSIVNQKYSHNSIESDPPQVDMQKYLGTIGKSIDYILVLGEHKNVTDKPENRTILNLLDKNYELVYTWNKRPHLSLYRKERGHFQQSHP